MAVTDFATKVAVVVREALVAWQRLSVCAFLMSGVVAGAHKAVNGLVRGSSATRGRLATLTTWSQRCSAPEMSPACG